MRLLLVLALTTPAAAEQQVRRLPPVDQAGAHPSFVQFRAQLLQAIGRRDAAFIESILAPDIKVSFGGEAGPADFRAAWKPEQPDSKLWPILGEVLRLGGSFDSTGWFVAPYVFSRFPDDIDSFEAVVAIGAGVALRAAPRTDAPVIARLSYDIVTLTAPYGPGDSWAQVRTGDGRSGHIAGHLVRSPMDYRAAFANRNGEWRMVYLIAGD